MTDVEKVKLTEKQEPLTAAKVRRGLWNDHDDPDTLRARQLSFMVTGSELPEGFLELVRHVITHKDMGEAGMNHRLLFIVALTTVSGDVVSGSHLEEMLQGLPRVQERGLRKLAPKSNRQQISSRLVLGGLSWRHLQLDGGPALLEKRAQSRRDVLKFQRRLVVIRASAPVLEAGAQVALSQNQLTEHLGSTTQFRDLKAIVKKRTDEVKMLREYIALAGFCFRSKWRSLCAGVARHRRGGGADCGRRLRGAWPPGNDPILRLSSFAASELGHALWISRVVVQEVERTPEELTELNSSRITLQLADRDTLLFDV
ncbi:hypothetical protein AK812_SmicGene27155 [Symbiodinium microadriaticum]|uniref:Uncharacterized protein n=1 Tax=Symbiodinium microadriaticum TaxID=2951 RepID=A0A1Q9D7Q1_SYMMI|nr:hypothetical protein AK812_SmicGene27155 [Symbiodinium microadriaticum]